MQPNKALVVNLYAVYPSSYDYCYFVFSKTANKAKSYCVNRMSDDEPYIDFRIITLKKDVDSEYEFTVVDSEDDKEYEYIQKLGFGFKEGDD